MNAHEQNIIRRDRAVPGMSLLFDAAALSEAIRARRPDLELNDLQPAYVRYKPGMNCLVAYEIGNEVVLYAKAHNQQDRVKLDKASDRPELDQDGRPTRLIIRDQSVVVSLFPTDAKLPSLKRIQSEKPRRRIAKLVRAGNVDVEFRQLRYKPERRFVAAAVANGKPLASVKFYTSRGMSRAHARAQAASRLADVCVPAELGANRRLGCLLYKWCDGASMKQIASARSLNVDILASAGRALATVHDQRHDTLPRPDPAELQSSLASARRALSYLLPEEDRLIDALCQKSEPTIDHWLDEDGWVHGDFHLDQILIGHDGPVILDFDRSFSGSGIVDVGTFAAHLEILVAADRLTRQRADEVLEGLTVGYEEVRPGAATAAASVTAACLFQLAVLPFRLRLDGWPDKTRILLDRCRQLSQSNRLSFGSVSVSSGRTKSKREACPAESTPYLDRALDLSRMSSEFETLRRSSGRQGLPSELGSAHLLKHRPGRRFVVEYRSNTLNEPAVIGKVRIRHLDRRTFEVTERLREAGFVDRGVYPCAVPEPLGCVPSMHMCIYAKAVGVPASAMTGADTAANVYRRIGTSLAALHNVRGITERQHTLTNEWEILGGRLSDVVEMRPNERGRIERIRDRCRELIERHGAGNPIVTLHRDFYPDNVIVSENGEISLIDLDLCALGHPGIDAGNFVAHLIELAARKYEDQRALDHLAEAFLRGYHDSAGAASPDDIADFATLSLARHLFLCCAIPGREHLLPLLLDVCEDRVSRHSASKRNFPITATR